MNNKNCQKPIKSVDIVIPVYNEASNLNPLIDRTLKAMYPLKYSFRIIFVDDGSSDDSVDIIRQWINKDKEHITLACLNRNYGQHAAIIAGFETCSADVIVTIDADLQNPPEGIPKLLDKMEEGNYDIVSSLRGGGRKDNLFRKAASGAKESLVRKITKSKIRDSGCMLKAYKKEIIDVLLQCKEKFIYIPILADSFARNTAEITVEHLERASGESKYNVWKLMQLFFDILTGSTYMPLRFLTVFGGVMCAASILFAIIIIVLRVLYGAEWAEGGVFTLFGILFFLMGLQFFIFGIMGEYLCRISMDVRQRPKYLISSVEGAEKSGSVKNN